MGSLLATITGQFGKPLILGTMLPVVLALIVFASIVAPRLGVEGPLGPWGKGPEGWALDFGFATLFLVGLLYSLNAQVQRLFEGYPWRSSLLGRWCTARFQAELDDLRTRRRHLIALKESPGLDPVLQAKIGSRLARLTEYLRSEFPQRSSVLPTRLGNIVRAAENYPRDEYGISSIPAWPRLVAVLPKEYASQMDDGKVTLDFFLNSSLLSAVSALVLLFFALPEAGAGLGAFVGWLAEVAGASFASVLFYRFALSPAKHWGGLFKGAFDLYRWLLLKQLGYQHLPIDVDRFAERDLWKGISKQFLFGDRSEYERDHGPWIERYR
ncbi:MAG: hypothetical protein SF066_16790 [Thermoanaerobaculia bacterium]|nr:hypothetical protein [Thermoanaerobaculia bacterium]